MPCLLLDDGALVKTIQFGTPRYIGDPVNVVSIFNRLEVDELVLLDIGATPQRRRLDLGLIADVAGECTAPLTYGGGVRDIEDVRRILEIGVEKIVINSRAGEDDTFIARAAERFGSQAIIASIDARRTFFGKYQVYTEGGRKSLKTDVVAYAQAAARRGAGEILLTSIDRDGTMQGYDLDLIRQVADAVDIPVIACGGAGKRADLALPVARAGASAVAAGSLFVFQGPGKGVLVNFPTPKQIEELLA